jgi:hypothetical protein
MAGGGPRGRGHHATDGAGRHRGGRGALRVEELGLTIAEAKTMLQSVQHALVTHQAAAALIAHAPCPDCGRVRSQKGHNTLVVRTLFGKLRLPSPRLYSCCCRPRESRSVSPLAEVLPERTTPELAYLESKFAALVSYGVTVDLLADVLPLGGAINVASLHRTLTRVGTRIDRDLGDEKGQFLDGCQRDWDALPPPGPPLTVGLDGGFVHAKDQPSRHEGWFEVIAGKSVPADGAGKVFAYVQNYDTKPKRRLFELLKSQGLQANQQVTFLSDGAEDVREVPLYLSPESEHWLDWFHITMRLTVLRQLAKGLEGAPAPTEDGDSEEQDESCPIDASEVATQLERVKCFLWHGNAPRALEVLDDLDDDLDLLPEPGECGRKLLKTLREFQGYIAMNRTYVPNYGDRFRHGEAISTAFAESTINQVVSKRMVKRQQMRWGQRGAHHLLQVRTKVLNGDLRQIFAGWYPGLRSEPEGEREALREAA